MLPGYTEIIFILDKSGSMGRVYDDVLGGLNVFLKEQKKDQDNTHLTFVQFDNNIEEIFISKPISTIQEFTEKDYILGGSTALLDAIGVTMNKMGKYFSDLSEDKRPENVILVIQTDGAENASREFNNQTIQDMIKHQEEKYNWNVVYLGATLEAFNKKNNIGLNAMHMMDYSNHSNVDAFQATSLRIRAVKSNNEIKSMDEYLNEVTHS